LVGASARATTIPGVDHQMSDAPEGAAETRALTLRCAVDCCRARLALGTAAADAPIGSRRSANPWSKDEPGAPVTAPHAHAAPCAVRGRGDGNTGCSRAGRKPTWPSTQPARYSSA
jgi:hypothetical protein